MLLLVACASKQIDSITAGVCQQGHSGVVREIVDHIAVDPAEEAVRWYRLVAAQGDAEAQRQLDRLDA